MHCGAHYRLREIALKDKPAHMIEVSSKGTVPVLILPSEDNVVTELAALERNTNPSTYRVIDQSIDIMRWAMIENPSRHLQNATEWLTTETMSSDEINELIKQNDFEFKGHLDNYKYSDRYPENPQAHYLEQAMPFLKKLEHTLSNSPYLSGNQFRFLDAAILPFVRQFSMVDPKQFRALTLPALQQWLAAGLESDLFISVMDKIPQWSGESSEDRVVFGDR